MIEIRKEESKDRDAVHHLNSTAFDNGPEAVLVDRLRASCREYLSQILHLRFKSRVKDDFYFHQPVSIVATEAYLFRIRKK